MHIAFVLFVWRKYLMGKDNDNIIEYGQSKLKDIYLLTIIGEVEGHECLPTSAKTTKYEHILPKLAEIENDSDIKGVLILLNTVGGDVESGLAIAEMIASLSKPTVSPLFTFFLIHIGNVSTPAVAIFIKSIPDWFNSSCA